MLFSFFFSFVLAQGLLVPPKIIDSFSNSNALSVKNGFVTFLEPAFLVQDDDVSILSLARYQDPSRSIPQQFTIACKINATAAKLHTLHLRPSILDSDKGMANDGDFVKEVAHKFVNFLDTKIGNSAELMLENLKCERNSREPDVLFCFARSGRVKREEPEVSAQLLNQVFQKVKLATERVSDNVDFLADDPKEFFVNLDEKFDDKISDLADKWEEASVQLNDGIMLNNVEEDTSEAVSDEEEDSSGYNGFHGLQVDT
ncbi:hypothetical protein C7M61_003121 [Candidozyma pseudohaemuli]|uniref:Uncharacterized protein n=1 Tax=Candidozyma pseudohaemuli TaxID=418784 RepID=A0A2P7YPI9_9ASCO|nr:hypothetical protein C7M61_003121 [[Candida] pseudohaemulonii]PSK37874.1 hypothetical protein C7M61_003121 [[Candida] pseudohaemulonii]